MTSNKFRFRKATEDDADALMHLINRAFEVELEFFTSERIDLDTTLEHFRKGIFLLVENGDKLAGCNYVEVRSDLGYFGLLSVDPDYQGRGIGRVLIEQAEAYCRNAGCGVMKIRVLNHRTELPPFYEKLGYKISEIETVEQEPTARMPYHFIVMEKAL